MEQSRWYALFPSSLCLLHPQLTLTSLPPPLALLVLVQEPVAFLGGAFAGALGLDITQEPLRSWVERTHTQAGVRDWPGIYHGWGVVHRMYVLRLLTAYHGFRPGHTQQRCV
jgi:hypothetical protein